MKKLLATGAALTLVGVMAGAAVAEVSIKGDARARMRYKDNYDILSTDASGRLTSDSRVRFQLKATTEGGAYAIGRIRMGDERWNGATDAATDTNIHADKAYIGIPFNDAFKIEAGQYRQTLTNFLYEDIGVAGIRALYDTDAVDVAVLYHVLSEGQDSSNPTDINDDNDQQQFGIQVKGMVAQDWTLLGQWVQTVDDRSGQDQEGGMGSFFFSGNVATFGIEGEIAYKEADLQGSEDDGIGGYVSASFNMDALTLTWDVGFTKDDFEADYIYGWYMLGGDTELSVTPLGGYGDWWWTGLKASFAVSEDLTLTGNLAYADIDAPTIDTNRLGDAWELSAEAKYLISKGSNFVFAAGYLANDWDGRLDDVVNDDGAYGFVGTFNVEF